MSGSVLSAFENGGSEVVVGNSRPPSVGSGPVERVQIGRPVLPCVRCLHRVVCAIKPALEAAAIEVRAPAAPHPDVRISVSVDLTCLHFADDGSPVEVSPKRIVPDFTTARLRGGEASKARHASPTGGGAGTSWQSPRREAQPRSPRANAPGTAGASRPDPCRARRSH